MTRSSEACGLPEVAQVGPVGLPDSIKLAHKAHTEARTQGDRAVRELVSGLERIAAMAKAIEHLPVIEPGVAEAVRGLADVLDARVETINGVLARRARS